MTLTPLLCFLIVAVHGLSDSVIVSHSSSFLDICFSEITCYGHTLFSPGGPVCWRLGLAVLVLLLGCCVMRVDLSGRSFLVFELNFVCQTDSFSVRSYPELFTIFTVQLELINI